MGKELTVIGGQRRFPVLVVSFCLFFSVQGPSTPVG